MGPADEHGDGARSVENLIARYAELVDSGDFAGLGEMFADGLFGGEGDAVVRGRDAVEKIFRATVQVYDDGTPRTKHVTTNIRVDVDDASGMAAHSYVTVFQALPDLPLQPIVAGRYRARSSAAPRRGVLLSGASRPTSSAMSAATCGAARIPAP